MSRDNGGIAALTDAELARLKELLEKATEGPWCVFDDKASYNRTICIDIGIAPKGTRPCIIDWQGFDSCELPIRQRVANAELIAAMKNALPSLLAEVERDRKDAERYRWLRDTAKGSPANAEFWPAVRLELMGETDKRWMNDLDGIDLDAAIDAALTAASKEGK